MVSGRVASLDVFGRVWTCLDVFGRDGAHARTPASLDGVEVSHHLRQPILGAGAGCEVWGQHRAEERLRLPVLQYQVRERGGEGGGWVVREAREVVSEAREVVGKW